MMPHRPSGDLNNNINGMGGGGGGGDDNNQNLISDNEFIEIEKVMQRASLIQNKEADRIRYIWSI